MARVADQRAVASWLCVAGFRRVCPCRGPRRAQRSCLVRRLAKGWVRVIVDGQEPLRLLFSSTKLDTVTSRRTVKMRVPSVKWSGNIFLYGICDRDYITNWAILSQILAWPDFQSLRQLCRAPAQIAQLGPQLRPPCPGPEGSISPPCAGRTRASCAYSGAASRRHSASVGRARPATVSARTIGTGSRFARCAKRCAELSAGARCARWARSAFGTL